MFDFYQEISNQSLLFGHLKHKHKYTCEDHPNDIPATHELKFTADAELSADTTYLCDDCTDNNHELGLLDGYDDLGNPNK